VVGIDSNDQSTGAMLWACEEAARRRAPLRFVTACPVVMAAAPSRPDPYITSTLEESTRETLDRISHRLRDGVEMLPVHVTTGPPRRVLLDALDEKTTMLVVGRRSIGAAQRVMVGSTSIAVAGRAPVPVVVVPDSWGPADRSSAPIVVGVSLGEGKHPADDDVLRFAFERAHVLRVPLIAVHAWEIPALYSWSPADIADFRGRVAKRLEEHLKPWRDEYPDVEVVASTTAERGVDAVLDASHVAQLAVVGRHTPDARHGGFRLGSTARGVLHGAKTPVAIIPAPPEHEDTPHHRHDSSDAWGPMF
jgi:nucleotide-binding universal stress UspA family protein